MNCTDQSPTIIAEVLLEMGSLVSEWKTSSADNKFYREQAESKNEQLSKMLSEKEKQIKEKADLISKLGTEKDSLINETYEQNKTIEQLRSMNKKQQETILVHLETLEALTEKNSNLNDDLSNMKDKADYLNEILVLIHDRSQSIVKRDQLKRGLIYLIRNWSRDAVASAKHNF